MKEYKFIADVMLGKLSKWLRIIGFDTLYYQNVNSAVLLALATQQSRQILTRRTNFPAPNSSKIKVFLITHNEPSLQLKETIKKFKLTIDPNSFFTLCLTCNQKLEKIHLERIRDRIPDYIANTHKDFSICPNCSKVYWKGTHYENICQKIDKVINVNCFSERFQSNVNT